MRSRFVSLGLGLTLLALCGSSGSAWADSPLLWLSPELRRIEAERLTLTHSLPLLPPAPAPQFTQRLGWHSHYSSSPDTFEWVDLRLERTEPLDAVVLIAPAPGGSATEPGYGFPLRFRVELINDEDQSERTIIADHTHADFPNPGLLPVVIPTHGHRTSKVRITATRLFAEDQRYLFALGEVMLLQGNRNLATEIEAVGPQSVPASSSEGTRPDWGRINLVDGHNVLGPPLGLKTSPTLGFRSKPVSERMIKSSPWVSVDLGRAMPIDEVRLFPAHPPEFAHSHGYGFPLRYQIELRENADSPPVLLNPPSSGSYNAPPGDNVVTLLAARRVARFVRLTVLEPHVSNGSALLALSEMQVWSAGKNVALGQKVSASDSTEANGWSSAALVDGFASSADIVDWPSWLAGLSKRRETLQQIASLEARSHRLTLQWQRYGLAALILITVSGIASAIMWSLRQKHARLREMEALRQRIARDLHDEIGSSLGSIALITQDLLANSDGTAQTREDLLQIKEIADETFGAMRDITRLIQSDRYGSDDLATMLRETASRLLRTTPHTLSVETSTPARKLPVDCQRDLILMFKEALHNITRHASATKVDIRLTQSGNGLTVTISDNGCGFETSASFEGMGITNLQRRAAKHGGNVRINSVPQQGTTLIITLPVHD